MKQRGTTLIEVLAALAVASFLIAGAVGVLAESRATYRAVEAAARLHENARFALEVLEPDLRMAGYWGLTTRGAAIRERSASPAVGNDCAEGWTARLGARIEASNGVYAWTCAPYGGSARDGADTLTVRRAAQEAATTLEPGVLYVRSARVEDGQLFVGPTAPPPPATAVWQTRKLVVHGYYVSLTSSSSTAGHAVPSLRRKTLQGGSSGPRIVDEEVLPGVEDLQIELGIDTDDEESQGRGSVNRYVHPDDPLLDEAHVRVLAVRLWLLLRAELPEAGFAANNPYAYADRRLPPPDDGYRRLLVAKTVSLRNAPEP